MNHTAPRDDGEPVPEDLGEVMSHIADSLGMSFCRKVAHHLGGLELRIPKNAAAMPESHLLVRELGREDAEALCGLFCGEKVYISRMGLNPHIEKVVAATLAGETTGQIARSLGVSQRQVRRLRAQALRHENRAGRPAGAHLPAE